MRLLTLLVSIQVVSAVVAILTLLYKYFLQKGYTVSSNRPIRLRWLGFYNSSEIYGTSSEIRRVVMQRNNNLSVVLWACLVVIIGLAILETRMPGGLR